MAKTAIRNDRRTNSDTDSHTYTISYANSDSYSYTYTISYANSDTYSYTQRHTYSDTDTECNSKPYTKSDLHTDTILNRDSKLYTEAHADPEVPANTAPAARPVIAAPSIGAFHE